MKHLLVLILFFSAMKGYTENSDKDTENMKQLAVEQGKLVFPCELAEDPSDNIKIFIHGENHISEEDRRFKEKLMLMGVTGDIYVGLEGHSYGPIDSVDFDSVDLILEKYGLDLNIEKSKLFGLEDEFVVH